MALPSGTRFGPYEILSPLGAGGMGEVYRARDTRLDRTVAIKVLPPHLSDNPEFRQRFEREARTVSSLSHPHICTLHDIGHQDGIDYLVMEFIEGESLADRLKKGPLPTERVLRYASEIAGALDRAHRAGIVHRDLKPGNIMLTKSGSKLLDFGLAKYYAGQTGTAADLTSLPTERHDITGEGAILGTFQYMAPEQLEGREADPRTDIFSFGAVVYEMATGKKAFTGKSQASLISAIMSHEPPSMVSLQPMVPTALERVVKTCLAKDPDERWQTAHDLLLELRWIAEGAYRSDTPETGRMKSRQWIAWTIAALAVLAALAFGAASISRRELPSNSVRFSIDAPAKALFVYNEVADFMTISPDGRRVAFVATSDGRTMLWVRPLDSLNAQPLAGTEGAICPFWSPDSRYIAFYADSKLKRIETIGGPVQIICSVPAGATSGSWGRDGTILFADVFAPPADLLLRVQASGGEPTRALSPQSKSEYRMWPWFLPDGKHYVYLSGIEGANTHNIKVGSLNSDDAVTLVEAQSRAVYGAPGFLFYVREGTLLAQPFDADKLRFSGEPVSIAERVRYFKPTDYAPISASETGVLAYQDGSTLSRLVWFNRDGRELAQVGTPGAYTQVRISPDGQRAVVALADSRTGAHDLWIYELNNSITTRFTYDPSSEFTPIWSPDGKRIVFSADRGAAPFLQIKALNDRGSGEGLLEPRGVQIPDDWSSDGKYLLYEQTLGQSTSDIWLLSLSDRKIRPFLNTHFNEADARFSPKGEWVAYVSDDSGKPEVYVQPFNSTGERMRVSSSGGTQPNWRRDGKELFYLSPQQELIAVPIKTGDRIQLGPAERLFKVDVAVGSSTYDVSADGKRFLVNARVSGPESTPITIVTNWLASMKKEP